MICIDQKIAALLTPLTSEEAALLEFSIKTEGCRDPLTIWSQGNTLLDGHHRHRICLAHNIPFEVREIDMADRRAAIEWRLANQLGRRNLTPLQTSYFRGKLFDSLKRPGTRNDLTSGQKVAGSLAARYGIDRRTLTRDALFARDLDRLAESLGEEFRFLVLTRQARLTRREVAELARMSAEDGRRFLQMRAASGKTAESEPAQAASLDDRAIESEPPADLHAAWERASREERVEFLARPDVHAALELLRRMAS